MYFSSGIIQIIITNLTLKLNFMKNLKLAILLSVIMAVMISCAPKTDNTDPKALYAEVTKNETPNTLTKQEKKAGWQLLFDGTTTDGWHGYNMKVFPDCWKIEDDCLTMNSVGGQEDQDIITNEKYRDFALSLEYKLTTGSQQRCDFPGS